MSTLYTVGTFIYILWLVIYIQSWYFIYRLWLEPIYIVYGWYFIYSLQLVPLYTVYGWYFIFSLCFSTWDEVSTTQSAAVVRDPALPVHSFDPPLLPVGVPREAVEGEAGARGPPVPAAGHHTRVNHRLERGGGEVSGARSVVVWLPKWRKTRGGYKRKE